jgi:hypothetical protein
MRELLLSIVPLAVAAGTLAAPGVVAQTTVSTGPGYANEVYYDLQHGVMRTEPLKAWDIAFQLNGFASAILTNGGAGVLLYSVPGKSAEDWSKPLDTTGMAVSWPLWYNSTDTWSNGAFNMGIDYSSGDFGWGEYNMATHVVSGTELYVIMLPDKSLRKIMIESLSGGVYTFRYAALDGSGEVVATIAKSSFAGKGFAYYSILDGKSLDREPALTDWDLLFGKYETKISGMQYPVTGVRSNQGVRVARVVTGTPATASAPDITAFSEGITTIGHDWKTFTGSEYEVSDSLAFFVQDTTDALYRIVFSSFGGSATGDFVFNQESLSASSVEDAEGITSTVGIYPSIASPGSDVQVVYSIGRGTPAARAALYDVTGRAISTIALDGAVGLHTASIQAPTTHGLYLVAVECGAQRICRRLLVR